MVAVNFFSFTDWIYHFLDCMGGCFGCCAKAIPIIAVDEPAKNLRIQGRAVKKPGDSDDFWSSSTCDYENSAAQSQRSASSLSVPSQIFNNTSNPEFVNNGYILWQEGRLKWVENGNSRSRPRQVWRQRLSWNATYESLLGSRNSFPRPIPLSEMVDFLVEAWENEGLYD